MSSTASLQLIRFKYHHLPYFISVVKFYPHPTTYFPLTKNVSGLSTTVRKGIFLIFPRTSRFIGFLSIRHHQGTGSLMERNYHQGTGSLIYFDKINHELQSQPFYATQHFTSKNSYAKTLFKSHFSFKNSRKNWSFPYFFVATPLRPLRHFSSRKF